MLRSRRIRLVSPGGVPLVKHPCDSHATRLNPVHLRTDRSTRTRSAPKAKHRLCIGQHPAIDGILSIPDRDEFDPGSDCLQERHPLFAYVPLLGNHHHHLLGGSPPRQLANRHIVFTEIENPYQLFRGEVFIRPRRRS